MYYVIYIVNIIDCSTYLPFKASLLLLGEPLFSHRGVGLQITKTLTISAILARFNSP